MIATSAEFWKAFFDPAHPRHAKARAGIKIFDREKIVLSAFVLAEVSRWLSERKKGRALEWFLDYAQNTANVRIFHFGKDEFAALARISADEGVPFERASLIYLERSLNVDVSD
ncbi:MAG: hypothetical protein AB1529_03420 [Candidatus Micrarchaeota archaeon]